MKADYCLFCQETTAHREQGSYSGFVDISHNGVNVRLNSPGIDYITNQLLQLNKFYECEMLQHIEKNHPVQKVMIDIGANFGNHAAFLENFIQHEQLFCFEPHPYNYMLLCSNVHRPSTVAYQLALGESSRLAKLHNKDIQYNSGCWRITEDEGIEVHVVSLDEFVDFYQVKDVTLIKIDTEGYELPILKGARRLLQRDHPLIYSEIGNITFPQYLMKIEDFLSQFEKDMPVVIFLKELGYTVTNHFVWDGILNLEFSYGKENLGN